MSMRFDGSAAIATAAGARFGGSPAPALIESAVVFLGRLRMANAAARSIEYLRTAGVANRLGLVR